MTDNGDKTFFDPIQHGRRRDDGHSYGAIIAAYGMKYNWLVTLLFAFFLMLGFGFKTPKDAFSELRASVDSNKIARLANVDTLQKQINATRNEALYLRSLLESSVTAQCLSLPKRVTASSGVPCAKLLRERGLE